MIDMLLGVVCVNNEEIGFGSTCSQIKEWVRGNGVAVIGPKSDEVMFYAMKGEEVCGVLFDAVLEVGSNGLEGLSLRRSSFYEGAVDFAGAVMLDIKNEFEFLVRFVEKCLGRKADFSRIREFKWVEKWGEVAVSMNPYVCEAAIFMSRAS